MRLDHIAYRTVSREKTAQFFIDALGYKIQTEFDLNFPDGSTTKCIALEPPEKLTSNAPWTYFSTDNLGIPTQEFHLPPEIFISDGSPDSIVGKWVERRGSSIHHLAYQVKSVQETMNEWKEKGYAEFASEEPLKCPGLTQVFTKPSELTGIIYEFIERENFGFCKENVQLLMESTQND